MSEHEHNAIEHQKDSRIEQIYAEALKQTKKDGGDPDKTRQIPLLDGVSPEQTKKQIAESLERMDSFIAVADRDKAGGLKISKETAEKIGSIWVFSGVGTFDQAIRPEDNRDLTPPFLEGTTRQRMNHAVLLSRRIAEAKSGKSLVLKGQASAKEIKAHNQKTKEILAQYGPRIIFGAFEDQNKNAEEVLEREGMVIPKENVTIVRMQNGEHMQSTADQVENFYTPKEAMNKEVAIISNDIHLNRILLILAKAVEQYPGRLPGGKPVHLFPVPTRIDGREEFSIMEAVKALEYIYEYRRAAKQPYPYVLDH